MVLFTTLYKVVLTFEYTDEILSVTIQMKATEQYFPVELCTMLHSVVLTFESAGRILKCNHSNKDTCIMQYFFVVFLISYAVHDTDSKVRVALVSMVKLTSFTLGAFTIFFA